jgi:hypothetical protein
LLLLNVIALLQWPDKLFEVIHDIARNLPICQKVAIVFGILTLLPYLCGLKTASLL